MKKNKILLILIFLLIGGYVIYSYIYQNHRDIASEKGSYSVNAIDIFSEFKTDEKKATAKYLDKTVEVSGKISNIDLKENTIVLDDKLFAVFKDKVSENFKPLSVVKIKGRFIGYDDLLEELKMDQCIIESD